MNQLLESNGAGQWSLLGSEGATERRLRKTFFRPPFTCATKFQDNFSSKCAKDTSCIDILAVEKNVSIPIWMAARVVAQCKGSLQQHQENWLGGGQYYAATGSSQAFRSTCPMKGDETTIEPRRAPNVKSYRCSSIPAYHQDSSADNCELRLISEPPLNLS